MASSPARPCSSCPLTCFYFRIQDRIQTRFRDCPRRPLGASAIALAVPSVLPRSPPPPLPCLRDRPHRPFHASVVAPIAHSMPPRSPPSPLPRLRGRPHRPFHASAIAPIALSAPPLSPHRHFRPSLCRCSRICCFLHPPPSHKEVPWLRSLIIFSLLTRGRILGQNPDKSLQSFPPHDIHRYESTALP